MTVPRLTVATSYAPTRNQMALIQSQKAKEEREREKAIRQHKRDEDAALYELTEKGREIVDKKNNGERHGNDR